MQGVGSRMLNAILQRGNVMHTKKFPNAEYSITSCDNWIVSVVVVLVLGTASATYEVELAGDPVRAQKQVSCRVFHCSKMTSVS